MFCIYVYAVLILIYLYYHLYSFITFILLFSFLQSKQILKLADYSHANQGVFDDYIQKHNEFRIEAQRKGRKNNALCHFAPLARVLQEYLADMDAKRDRGEQISQHDEQRAYHLSCLLWSISHDLDDLRKDEEFDWINTFVDYET